MRNCVESLFLPFTFGTPRGCIVHAGAVSVWAGSGTAGFADGIGSAATFNQPNGITGVSSGDIYVADYGNNLLRLISSAGLAAPPHRVFGVTKLMMSIVMLSLQE